MKKKYYYPLYFFLVLIITENTVVNAQDIHLTQYNASPQNLNPAQTGLFDGDWRLAGNYRNQWSSISNVPFNTYSFSGDTRLKTTKLKGATPALGFVINSDKTGDSKLKSTQVYLSASIIKKLTKDSTHLISVGVQPGIANKNFNANVATFDQQFDGLVYNPGLSSGENFPSTSLTYFDVGAGAAYYWRKTPRKNINIGFSAYHLTQPKQSFYGDNTSTLSPKYNISGTAELPLGSKFGVVPSFLIQRQGETKETLLGVSGKYYFTSILDQTVTSLSLGAFIRAQDAYAIVLNMQYQNLNIGMSYDINYSNLTAATNYRGAFELSVVYIHKKAIKVFSEKRPSPIFM